MDSITPSHFLFPLGQLRTLSEDIVATTIERLHYIFSKDHSLTEDAVRHIDNFLGKPSARRNSSKRTPKGEIIIDSGYASAESDDEGDGEGVGHALEAIHVIRNDSFEKDFTIRWLTGFIARASTWAFSDPCLADNIVERREALIEKAATILTICAGSDDDSDEALLREFKFTLRPSGKEFTVVLDDLIAAEDHSSVGLQSWASSIYFAKMLCDDPSKYGLLSDEPLRILELGAGTGLLSLTSANITSPSTELIATDYHPDVLANLKHNVDLNFQSSHRPITVQAFDWQYPSYESPLDKPFRVILAADVVYEPCHPGWIKNCVERLLERPSERCTEGGVFWMIVAVRTTGRHEGLASSVLETFPMVSDDNGGISVSLSLRTIFVLDVARSDGVGRADESGYRLFKICWA